MTNNPTNMNINEFDADRDLIPVDVDCDDNNEYILQWFDVPDQLLMAFAHLLVFKMNPTASIAVYVIHPMAKLLKISRTKQIACKCMDCVMVHFYMTQIQCSNERGLGSDSLYGSKSDCTSHGTCFTNTHDGTDPYCTPYSSNVHLR